MVNAVNNNLINTKKAAVSFGNTNPLSGKITTDNLREIHDEYKKITEESGHNSFIFDTIGLGVAALASYGAAMLFLKKFDVKVVNKFVTSLSEQYENLGRRNTKSFSNKLLNKLENAAKKLVDFLTKEAKTGKKSYIDKLNEKATTTEAKNELIQKLQGMFNQNSDSQKKIFPLAHRLWEWTKVFLASSVGAFAVETTQGGSKRNPEVDPDKLQMIIDKTLSKNPDGTPEGKIEEGGGE